MPRYFFHVHNGDETLDYEGADLADDEAARAYAIAAARALAGETASKGHIGLSDCIEILNAARKPVGSVTFGDAVEIRP